MTDMLQAAAESLGIIDFFVAFWIKGIDVYNWYQVRKLKKQGWKFKEI